MQKPLGQIVATTRPSVELPSYVKAGELSVESEQPLALLISIHPATTGPSTPRPTSAGDAMLTLKGLHMTNAVIPGAFRWTSPTKPTLLSSE